ncbi:MAG: MATE family efflux transporter [Oscillospiraceae bacterium]|nr:MATE family efflux transporter [Oscillospiraceae bacterium]MDY4192232.1 MATE family efflux transporter [Oscillospiraceae bacterium]
MSFFSSDHTFYKKLFAIALPVAGQNLINMGVSMMDTLMLGTLGEVALSASSIANQLFFMLMTVSFGLSGGANVMIAQYWGKGDTAQIRRITSVLLRTVIGAALLFTAAAFFRPQLVMKIFTNDAAVIEAGVKYLHITGAYYVFYAFSTTINFVLRSVGTVRIAMVTSVTTLVSNVFLNWVFIFGNLGCPAMGIEGAALATAISRLIEFAIMVYYVFFREDKIRMRFSDLISTGRGIYAQFTRNAVPVLCNEMIWTLGSSVITAIISHMGTEYTAAMSIASVVTQLASVMIWGVSSGAAAVIGNSIGAGRLEDVRREARSIMLISALLGLFSSAVILFLRGWVVDLYNITENTRLYAMQIMAVHSVVVFFEALDFNTMTGTLRGGGDTKFVLIVDVIFMWTVAIPLGFLTGNYLHLSIPVVYACLKCDELLKCMIAIPHALGKKWIKDVTVS